MEIEYSHRSADGISIGVAIDDLGAIYLAAAFANLRLDNFSRGEARKLIKKRLGTAINRRNLNLGPKVYSPWPNTHYVNFVEIYPDAGGLTTPQDILRDGFRNLFQEMDLEELTVRRERRFNNGGYYEYTSDVNAIWGKIKILFGQYLTNQQVIKKQ